MNITKLFLVDYMEFISNIILPELHLNCDPRWVVDVLQQVLFYIHLHEFKPFQPSVVFHIEASHLLCSAKQMTGFHMKCNARLKCVCIPFLSNELH